MSLFEILLAVHILAVSVWIGGAFAVVLVGRLLMGAGDAGNMAAYCRVLARIGGPLFGGTGGIVLLSGIWMVALDGYPGFGETWVTIGFVGWLLSTIIGAAFVGRLWAGIGTELDGGATLEAVAPTARRAKLFADVDMLLRVVIVFVMVARPT